MAIVTPGSSYYFSDMAPTSVCVEWPYAYVTGSKAGQGGNYTMECRKLRIDSYPITVVDYFTYLIRPVWTYLLGCRLSGDYLYLAGGYNGRTVASPAWRYTCIKVDKTLLSTVIWNHNETGVAYGQAYSSYWQDVKANSTDTFVVCSGVSNTYGAVYKLNASTGEMLLRVEAIYSNISGGILDFYSSEAYVDVAGSHGGNPKAIYRFNIANLAFVELGSPYYSYTGGELYDGSYYLGGSYYASGSLWQKPVWKLLQTTCAIQWSGYRDDKAGTIYEGNTCATVDGPGGYVYTSGLQYTGPGNYDTPIVGTLSKYDLSGNFQWAISYGDNVYSGYPKSLTNYGDYLISTEINAATTGTGWLRVRNKSDGAIATNLPPMGHYFPTFFQV